MPKAEPDLDEYLRDCVRIEPAAIEEEFVRLPGDLAYWNARLADAFVEHLVAKRDRERLHAALMIDPDFLAELESDLGKKPTVDQIKAGAETNEAYIEARNTEDTAYAERLRLRGCVDAIAAKKDCLVSLGSHIRIELEHDAVLREHAAAKRAT